MSVTTVSGTIVFTDIVGFTQLTDEHGDDVALTLLERQEALVRRSLPDGARVVKELGDGLLLWFDDASVAIPCALSLQRAFEHESDDDLPMWTLADLEACGCEIKSPNIRTAEEMGLPNGSWHDPSQPDGAVVTSETSYVNRAGSIGGDGLETGAAMRSNGNGRGGRRNVAEVIR